MCKGHHAFNSILMSQSVGFTISQDSSKKRSRENTVILLVLIRPTVQNNCRKPEATTLDQNDCGDEGTTIKLHSFQKIMDNDTTLIYREEERNHCGL